MNALGIMGDVSLERNIWRNIIRALRKHHLRRQGFMSVAEVDEMPRSLRDTRGITLCCRMPMTKYC